MFGDYDLGDGLGRRNCSHWSSASVGPCAGTCGHLWDVQDDVGGTNVGDGVLFKVVSWVDGLVTNRGRGCRRWVHHRRRWGRSSLHLL